MKNFFKSIWHEVEPLIVELFVYSTLIIAVYVVSNFTDSFVPLKWKEIISAIKSIVIIGALSLSALHTLGKMFIRVIKSFVKEVKSDDDDDFSDEDANNGSSDSEVMPNRLNPKSLEFDDAKQFQNAEDRDEVKVNKESERKK